MASLRIYDEKGQLKRVSNSATVDFEFGIIRRLAALIKIDEMENDLDILTAVTQAWVSVTELLSKCFPDVTDEEWDRVKVTEFLPLIIGIFKDLFTQMARIPTSKKE